MGRVSRALTFVCNAYEKVMKSSSMLDDIKEEILRGVKPL